MVLSLQNCSFVVIGLSTLTNLTNESSVHRNYSRKSIIQTNWGMACS